MGVMKPLRRFGAMLRDLSFERQSKWRTRILETRRVDLEASSFAQILNRYQSLLAGKRLIVFEIEQLGYQFAEI